MVLVRIRLEVVNRLIPAEHVTEVCKPGQGALCCRYLILGPEGFECAKEGEFSEYFDRCVEAGTMVAQGDNCDGVWSVSQEGT